MPTTRNHPRLITLALLAAVFICLFGAKVAMAAVVITEPLPGVYPWPILLPIKVDVYEPEVVNRVDLYLGDLLLGSKNAAPFNFSWRTRPDPIFGDHHRSPLIAVACFANGVCVTSAPVVISITQDPPHIFPKFLKPLTNLSILAGQPLVVKAQVYAQGNETNAVQIGTFTSVLGTAYWPDYMVILTNLSEGTYPLILLAYDQMGNGGIDIGPTVQVGNILVTTEGFGRSGDLRLKLDSIYTNGIITLEKSPDFAAWAPLTNAAAGTPFVLTLPIEERFRFYRASWKP